MNTHCLLLFSISCVVCFSIARHINDDEEVIDEYSLGNSPENSPLVRSYDMYIEVLVSFL